MAEPGDAPDTARLVPGLRVRVHYNLHRGGFSVVAGNRVAANVADITLTAVTFRVQPAGLARIRREGRREVCAYATGLIEAFQTAPDVTAMQKVAFNPHRTDTFTLRDGTPVHAAPRVLFAPDPADRAVRSNRRPGYGWTPRCSLHLDHPGLCGPYRQPGPEDCQRCGAVGRLTHAGAASLTGPPRPAASKRGQAVTTATASPAARWMDALGETGPTAEDSHPRGAPGLHCRRRRGAA